MKRLGVRLSFAILFAIILGAIFAPLVSRVEYTAQNMDRILLLPNTLNWFGTDALGRDLFSRVLYGARVSLVVAFISSVLALIVGIFYGGVAGYSGPRVGRVLMSVVDLFQSFPPLVLMILVSVIFNAKGLGFLNSLSRDLIAMIVALSLIGWMNVSKLVRNQVLQLREQPFVMAARAAGGSSSRIIFRHIIPNMWSSLIVVFTFLIPSQILYESFLSFIGLGLQPPYSSWGVLANEGWRSFRVYPHLILFPGAAIFMTILVIQVLGDGLQRRVT